MLLGLRCDDGRAFNQRPQTVLSGALALVRDVGVAAKGWPGSSRRTLAVPTLGLMRFKLLFFSFSHANRQFNSVTPWEKLNHKFGSFCPELEYRSSSRHKAEAIYNEGKKHMKKR